MMALLKSLSTSIEKTKEDIKLLLSQQSNQNTRKSFLDVQKELLDAELELFNAQQDGSESVEDIQKRVNKLRVEVSLIIIQGMNIQRVQNSIYQIVLGLLFQIMIHLFYISQSSFTQIYQIKNGSAISV